ncbi:MAG: TonB-dependent receptor plug domain-containing protein, partial [Vicinamibacterales bacterium]
MSYTNAAANLRRFGFMSTASTVAMLAASFAAQAQTAPAQQAQTDAAAVADEIVVTGTRVVRDGYEAPTPVTVIGVEQIEQAPLQHISDFVMRLPAFAGSQHTSSGGNEISTGRQSQNNLNLRGLDSFRTLVLLDGNRFVSGDVNGSVNASDLPTPLISRVDVVTGGASAAYGSDAVAGVVNFVLDREFTGVKAEIQGGITARGDDPSYKVALTAGTPFAGGRGHILFSGEHAWNKGIFGAGESRGKFWGYDTYHIIENPAWNTTTGRANPRFLVRSQVGSILATPNGIITAGPLKGVTFDRSGRAAGMYNYGSLTNSQFTVGGDWQQSDATFYNQTLSNHVTRQAYFGRVSYDINDETTVYANWIYTYSYGYARSKLDDQLGNLNIRIDNAYLDPAIAARMTALGLSQFTMGSFLHDVPYIQTDNYRELWTYQAGAEGSITAFSTDWAWKIHGQYGLTRGDLSGRVLDLQRLRSLGGTFTNALDSVRLPNGQIVCRGNVDPAIPDDPLCVPFNPFGSGVNSAAAIEYVKGRAQLYQRNAQEFYAFSLTGEPFDTWAGPVSLALGAEYRTESVTPGNIAGYCPKCLTSSYTAGNYKGTLGKYNVKEAFIETVVPLANDEEWAQLFDLNGAVRFTDYSTSGFVTTWKVGVTYAPVDDVRLRASRSRDIRAGNLGELYNAGGGGQSPGLVDPFRTTSPTQPPTQGQQYTWLNSTSGNPLLEPEKADQTNMGIVYQPSWFPGFSASADYYDITINGAIETPGEVLQRCFDSG